MLLSFSPFPVRNPDYGPGKFVFHVWDLELFGYPMSFASKIFHFSERLFHCGQQQHGGGGCHVWLVIRPSLPFSVQPGKIIVVSSA